MKTRKKFVALVLSMVVCVAVLSGCGMDAMSVEFTKFVTTDIVAVEEKYEEVSNEVDSWATMADAAEISKSIEEEVMVKLDEAMDTLSKIEVKSDEVKGMKENYMSMLKAQKEGFELMLQAMETGDESLMDQSEEKLNESLEYAEAYDAEMERIIEEKNIPIEIEE